MKTVKIFDKQNLLDIAAQQFGNVDDVFLLIKENKLDLAGNPDLTKLLKIPLSESSQLQAYLEKKIIATDTDFAPTPAYYYNAYPPSDDNAFDNDEEYPVDLSQIYLDNLEFSVRENIYEPGVTNTATYAHIILLYYIKNNNTVPVQFSGGIIVNGFTITTHGGSIPPGQTYGNSMTIQDPPFIGTYINDLDVRITVGSATRDENVVILYRGYSQSYRIQNNFKLYYQDLANNRVSLANAVISKSTVPVSNLNLFYEDLNYIVPIYYLFRWRILKSDGTNYNIINESSGSIYDYSRTPKYLTAILPVEVGDYRFEVLEVSRDLGLTVNFSIVI